MVQGETVQQERWMQQQTRKKVVQEQQVSSGTSTGTRETTIPTTPYPNKPTVTKEQFEQQKGVTLDLPKGALITGYQEVPTSREEYERAHGKTWTETEFEKQFNTQISPDLPATALITGVEGGQVKYLTELPKSFNIQYITPSLPTVIREQVRPTTGRWGSEFGEGWLPVMAPVAQLTVEEKVVGSMAFLAIALPPVAPSILPASLGITTKALIASSLVSIGVSEGYEYATTGKHLTPEGVVSAAFFGQTFYIGGKVVSAGLGKVLSPSASSYMKQLMTSPIGRAGVTSALWAGTSYITSGGKVEEAVKGAVFGAALSTGIDVLRWGGGKARGIIKPYAEEYLTKKWAESNYTGGFSKGLEPFEGEFGFQKLSLASEVPSQGWLGLPEKFVMKVSGVRSPKLAVGLVDIPEFGEPIATSLFKQETAWEFAVSPKQSALLITKYTGPTGAGLASAWVEEHWLGKAMGGLSYALVSKEFQNVKVVQNRQGVPFLRTMEPMGKTMTKQIPLSMLMGVPKLKPLGKEKTDFAVMSLPVNILKQIAPQASMVRQKQKTRQIYGLASFQLSRQALKQIQAQAMPAFMFQPSTFQSVGVFPHGGFPSEGGYGNAGALLGGKWFFRKYPVKSPKQVMKGIVGFPKTKRRRR